MLTHQTFANNSACELLYYSLFSLVKPGFDFKSPFLGFRVHFSFGGKPWENEVICGIGLAIQALFW